MIDMIINFCMQIIFLAVFLAPAVILSYLIFPRLDIIERSAYAIALGVPIFLAEAILLNSLSFLSKTGIFMISVAICDLLMLVLLFKVRKIKFETNWNKDFLYVLLLSVLGTAWKIFFALPIKNYGSAYDYAVQFTNSNIPDVGFYTGMILDHAKYFGSKILADAYSLFFFRGSVINIFCITFLFLSFIYLIFREFRKKNSLISYLGLAIMAFGPIEIFHSSRNLTGAGLSYVLLFSLFLLFKKEDNKIFFVSLALALTASLVYYTSVMVALIASAGFVIALGLKELIGKKSIAKAFFGCIKSKKCWAFIFIALLMALSIFIFSNMGRFSSNKLSNTAEISDSILTLSQPLIIQLSPEEAANIGKVQYSQTVYRAPIFLNISAIGWQSIFFILCGGTFILYLLFKKNFSKENLDLLVCLIPVMIVSYAFFHVNMIARIFNYFCFFGLLVLKIPKKVFRIFCIFSLLFILITGFYVIENKRLAFENSEGEVQAAEWVAYYLDGKLFSDQKFINQVISNGYYNLTGAADESPIVKNLFYNLNSSRFMATVSHINTRERVKYIAITKRMQENYILMLNYPQIPMKNIALYEENLDKIYDDGDVKIYKIELKKQAYEELEYENRGIPQLP